MLTLIPPLPLPPSLSVVLPHPHPLPNLKPSPHPIKPRPTNNPPNLLLIQFPPLRLCAVNDVLDE